MKDLQQHKGVRKNFGLYDVVFEFAMRSNCTEAFENPPTATRKKEESNLLAKIKVDEAVPQDLLGVDRPSRRLQHHYPETSTSRSSEEGIREGTSTIRYGRLAATIKALANWSSIYDPRKRLSFDIPRTTVVS